VFFKEQPHSFLAQSTSLEAAKITLLSFCHFFFPPEETLLAAVPSIFIHHKVTAYALPLVNQPVFDGLLRLDNLFSCGKKKQQPPLTLFLINAFFFPFHVTSVGFIVFYLFGVMNGEFSPLLTLKKSPPPLTYSCRAADKRDLSSPVAKSMIGLSKEPSPFPKRLGSLLSLWHVSHRP